MKGCRWAFGVIVMLLAGVAPGASPPDTQRPELLPKGVRWQEFPADVRWVVFDSRNKPWFESSGKATLEEIRTQVERGMEQAAPCVRGARIIHFDRSNRIWLLPTDQQDTLLCYDPASKSWLQDQSWRDPKDEASAKQHEFRGQVCESRKGVLYFGGERGVYTLSGETWGYQPFYDVNIQKGLYNEVMRGHFNKSFSRIEFAESPDGTVYAWSRWGMPSEKTGTLGCWRHDGETWRQILQSAGDHYGGHIARVEPIGPHLIYVAFGSDAQGANEFMFGSGAAMAAEVGAQIKKLGDESEAVRESARTVLLEMGRLILPQLQEAIETATDESVKGTLQSVVEATRKPPWPGYAIDGWKMWGVHFVERDAKGNAAIWTSLSESPDGKKTKTPLYFRVSPEGKLTPATEAIMALRWTFKSRAGRTYSFGNYGPISPGIYRFENDTFLPITTKKENDYNYLVGDDDKGRIYLSSAQGGTGEATLRPPGTHILLFDPSMAESRPTLPSETFKVHYSSNIVLDSRGCLWARREGTPFLSCYENGGWKDYPLPENAKPSKSIGAVQAMAEGGLVAIGQGAFIFSDGKWRAYPSVGELVEKKFALLQKNLLNHSPRGDMQFLRKDAAGNIWARKPMGYEVYTGNKWLALADKRLSASSLQPADGNKMLVLGSQGALAEIVGDELQITRPASVSNFGGGGYNPTGVSVDSAGRTWVSNGKNQKVIYFDRDGRHDVPGSPMHPDYEDSAKRMWFISTVSKKLSVLLMDGMLQEFPEAHLAQNSSLAEDHPGSLWLTTGHGLVHYQIGEADGKLTLTRIAEFTANIPHGGLLWADASGNLWLCTASELWRITTQPQ